MAFRHRLTLALGGVTSYAARMSSTRISYPINARRATVYRALLDPREVDGAGWHDLPRA